VKRYRNPRQNPTQTPLVLSILFTVFCLEGLLSLCDGFTAQKLVWVESNFVTFSLLTRLYLVCKSQNELACDCPQVSTRYRNKHQGVTQLIPLTRKECHQSSAASAQVTFKVYKSLVRYVPCSADGHFAFSLHALEHAQVYKNERNDC